MSKIIKIGIVVVVIVILMAIWVMSASANPSYFATTYYLNTSATTTTTTINPNNTTSFTVDSYNNGNNTKIDSATLLTQYTASNSPATLKIEVNYSSNGIDWFENNVDLSTTTVVRDITSPIYFSLTASTTASTTRVANRISIPTRYVKITYRGATATSSVWAELTPTKERP